jgi:hypothetical protein
MDTPIVQPPIHKFNRKSLFIRLFVYALGIVFFILICFIASKVYPGNYGKSVLGAQTSPNPLLSGLAMLLKVNPEISNQQKYIIQSTPTPTPIRLLILPSATPTPKPMLRIQPSPSVIRMILLVSPTPASGIASPPAQINQPPMNGDYTRSTFNPSKFFSSVVMQQGSVSADLAWSNQAKQVIKNTGITLTGSETTTDLAAKITTVKGEVRDKIFGIFNVSYLVTLTVNKDRVLTENAARPWWLNLVSNPLGKIACTGIIGGTACLNAGCSYYGICGKCGDKNGPAPGPACECAGLQQSQCSTSGCQWNPECGSNGTCSAEARTAKDACGGCQNMNPHYCALPDLDSNWIDNCVLNPTCGRCEDYGASDPTCTCAADKDPDICNLSESGCTWVDQCSGGGVCVPVGTSYKDACGGCQNIDLSTCENNTIHNITKDCYFSWICNRCETTGVSDPTCTCAANTTDKDVCNNMGNDCSWHPECGSSGACAAIGLDTKDACGGCQNMNLKYCAFPDLDHPIGSNGCAFNPTCGRCEDYGVSDPTCTCAANKDPNMCNYPGNGCAWSNVCNKCVTVGIRDSTCTCAANKDPKTCKAASVCTWHPECNGSGVCTDKNAPFTTKACSRK